MVAPTLLIVPADADKRAAYLAANIPQQAQQGQVIKGNRYWLASLALATRIFKEILFIIWNNTMLLRSG